VLPSVPGYGFSGEPTEIGWNPGRVARAWAELIGLGGILPKCRALRNTTLNDESSRRGT
jgi:hypothetical protein